eukprot:m.39091 g.39091  ORF g.39091 m.39091 type:complete len:2511 (+) comp9510_c0_seq1:237-7769(+)
METKNMALKLQSVLVFLCLSVRGTQAGCNDCRVADKKHTSDYIDLSPLSLDGDDWKVVGTNPNGEKYQYHINICKGLQQEKCGLEDGDVTVKASACQVEDMEDKANPHKFVLGSMESNACSIDWADDNDKNNGITITMKGGTGNDATCGGKERTVEVNLYCDENAHLGSPIFTGEVDCVYKFSWATEVACWNKRKTEVEEIKCEFTNMDTLETYDLSELSKTKYNYQDTDDKNEYVYHINVCAPLAPRNDGGPAFDGECAKSNTSVCQTKIGEDSFFKSLGVASGPKYDHERDQLYLEFLHGTPCSSGERRTRIDMVCAQDALEGTPQFLSEPENITDGCLYLFEWRSAYACPRSNGQPVVGDSCDVKDDVLGDAFIYQLSGVQGPWNITDGDYTYYLGLCGGISDQCDGGACRVDSTGKKDVIGKATKTTYPVPTFSRGTMLMHMPTDRDCGSDGDKVQTTIRYICDRSVGHGMETPTLVRDSECEVVFEILTEKTCPAAEMPPCQFEHNGETFDLTPLKRTRDEQPWQTQFDKYEYMINICGAVEGPDACNNNMACQKEKDVSGTTLNSKGLGEYLNPIEVSDSNGRYRITLNFTRGEFCNHNNMQRFTTIILQCDPNAGADSGPAFVSETDCFYMFEWSTPYACPQQDITPPPPTTQCEVTGLSGVFDLSPLRTTTPYQVEGPEGSTFNFNVCGSVSDCNGGGMCLEDRGSKASLGEPSTALELNDGIVKVIYEGGETCDTDSSRKYSSEIVFVCPDDQEMGENTISDPLTFTGLDDCRYHFNFVTSIVCPEKPLDCVVEHGDHVFDFSSLVKDGQKDYIIQEGNNIYYINICRSITSDVDACPKDGGRSAGACVLKGEAGADGAVSFGAASAPKYQDDEPVLEYMSGGHTLRIKLHCPVSGDPESDGPEFVRHDEATHTHEFIWATHTACGTFQTSNACQINGFDMSALRDHGEFEVQDPQGQKYFLSVCKRKSGGQCDQHAKDSKALACQQAGNGQWYSLGYAPSDTVYAFNGIPRLWYRNGTVCHQNGGASGFYRTLVVDFKCDPNVQGIGAPEFAAESGDCTYYMDWYTPLACKKEETSCYVTYNNNLYDLSELTNHRGNYKVQDSTGSTWQFNICRELVPHTNCGVENGACLDQSNGKTFDLGNPGPVQYNVLTEEPFVMFQNADCKTTVVFECARDALGNVVEELGTPVLDSSDGGCVAKISWKTSAACPKSEDKPDEGNLAKCTVTDSVGNFFDFSPLKGKVLNAKHDSEEYHVALCDELSGFNGCEGFAACQKDSNGNLHGMGTRDKGSLTVEGNKIELKYGGGQLCHEKYERSVEIKIECSDKDTEELLYVDEDGECTYFLTLKTKLACTKSSASVDVSPCEVVGNGVRYDLSSLKRTLPAASYIASDKSENNDFKYFINVCHSLTKVSDYGDYPCDLSAAVCQVGVSSSEDPTKMDTWSLGKPAGPIIQDDKLILKYADGDSAGCNKPRETQIEMICNKFAGDNTVPTFIEESPNQKCLYKMTWETPAACGINDSSEPDKVLPSSSCPDGLQGLQEIHVVAEDDFFSMDLPGYKETYALNPCGQVDGCDQGSVCLTTNGAKKSLGKFQKPATINDNDVTIEYTNGVECPLNERSSDPARTKIVYECTNQDDDTIFFDDFKEDLCEFQFTWKTNAACKNPNGATKIQCVGEGEKTSVDFGELYNPNEDIIVETGTDLRLEVNLCGTLVGKSEGDACAGAAACADGRPVGFLDDGPDTSYDGAYYLFYPNEKAGFMCGTWILFICDKTKTTPVLSKHEANDECDYTIEWYTHLACEDDDSGSDTDKPVEIGQCRLQTYETFYDLTKLKGTVTLEDGSLLSICAPLFDSECSGQSGYCKNKESHGAANSALRVDNGDLVLEYTNGDRCVSDQQNTFSTKIHFTCGFDEGKPKLDDFLSSKCNSVFRWETKYACKHNTHVECLATSEDGSKQIDISPLMRAGAEANWNVIQDESKKALYEFEYEYDLNICHELNSPKSGCIGAAICQVGDNVEHTKNLGSVLKGPTIEESTGDIIIKYGNGDLCGDINRETEVRIICDAEKGTGQPVFDGEPSTCKYSISWRTALACESNSDDVNSESCTIDNFFGNSLDLGWTGNSIVQIVTDAEWSWTKKTYTLRLCGGPKLSGCSGDACLDGVSLGKATGLQVTGSTITYSYEDGDDCAVDSSKRMSAQILFECDKTQTDTRKANIELRENSGCAVTFVLKTAAVCTSEFVACTAYDQKAGVTYDFNTLVADGPISFSDGKGGTITTKLCQALSTSSGCPYGTAVCKTDSSGRSTAIGAMDNSVHFEWIGEGEDEVLMTYNGGSCGSGTGGKTEIHFQCDNNAGHGTPELETDKDCNYHVDWATCLVCGENACKPTYEAPRSTTPGSANETPANKDSSSKSKHHHASSAATIVFLVILGCILMLVLRSKDRRERILACVGLGPSGPPLYKPLNPRGDGGYEQGLLDGLGDDDDDNELGEPEELELETQKKDDDVDLLS